MMRPFFVPILLFVVAVGVFGQTPAATLDLSNYGVRIEPDKRLITVLATLEMAGTREQPLLNPSLSPAGMKFRERVLVDHADIPADLRTKITAFVTQYKKRNASASDAEIIEPFISMAYTLTPAPELSDPVITSDLPGRLLDVLDFAPLVREFYRRSSIAAKLDDYVKEYRLLADGKLRTSTREMVSELLDYLNTRPQLIFTEKVKTQTRKGNSKSQTLEKTEIVEHDRRFIIVPEALAPRGDINFVNIRDDYYLVIPPDTDLTTSDGRRAFLRFVVDPLILANSKEMTTVRDWTKPALEELRKTNAEVSPDVFLAMSRSLVAAIDVRQAEFNRIRIATDQARQKMAAVKVDPDKKIYRDLEKQKEAFADESALQLYEDYKNGSVLAFYFAEQLKGLENSGFDIASSLKEMVASFDPIKEANRINDTAEARKRALAAREDRKKNPDTVAVVENPVTAKLIDIQKAIDAKDLAKANADLKQLLSQYPSEPRIYYNIGRVAGLAAARINDPEAQAAKVMEAKVAYTNVINTKTPQTDKTLLSLTYLALGRVYEFFNDDAYAVKLYDEAIKIGEVRDGGYRDAIDAKQRLVRP